MFVAYQSGTSLFSQSLRDGADTWSSPVRLPLAEAAPAPSLATSAGPSLASAEEDVYAPNTGSGLWLVWRSAAHIVGEEQRPEGAIAFSEFDTTTMTWPEPSYITRALNNDTNAASVEFQSATSIDAAFFRGRLQVIGTEVHIDDTFPPGRSVMNFVNSLWIASCAPPFCTPDGPSVFWPCGMPHLCAGHVTEAPAGTGWSPFVQQDSGSGLAPRLDAWRTHDGRLHIYHNTPDALIVWQRQHLAD
jgi:hypothetical protein